MAAYFSIILTVMLVNNYVLAQFLGHLLIIVNGVNTA